MIILFGLTGSGKSTQGQILAEKFGYKWLSVGQAIRASGKFSQELKTGDLINDDVVIEIIADAISRAEADGVDLVLDGFPRNEAQAHWLVDHFARYINSALYLDVPKPEIIERLELRGRADDTKESIAHRFDIAEQNIYSILAVLKSKNISVKHVDGSGEVEEVAKRLEKMIK